MKKKITFINPKDFCKFIAKTPYPPLGVAYLAAVLREKGYRVDLIDGQILPSHKYENALRTISSELIGITATIKQIKEANRIAAFLKKQNSKRIIIYGGAGPSSLSLKETFKSKNVDFLIKGEAEETLSLLLEKISQGLSLSSVPNLAYFNNGKLTENKNASNPKDLDVLPFPARDIFPQGEYLTCWKKNTGITSVAIMSSRGCPFSCIFCDKSISGPQIRTRSAKSTIDEMEQIVKAYSPDDIFFYDDLFTFNKDRVLEICKEIFSRGLKLTWSAQGRVDTIDEQMLGIMKKAGCTEVYFGIESGSNKILNYLGKRFTRKQIIHAFNICHKVGLKPGAYLIVGVPGETKKDIEDTKSMIEKIKPFLLNFSYLTPFPNTKLYNTTKHLLKSQDFSKWDEMSCSPYRSECFEIDPKISHDEIYSVFKDLVRKKMGHSFLQFLCEQ